MCVNLLRKIITRHERIIHVPKSIPESDLQFFKSYYLNAATIVNILKILSPNQNLVSSLLEKLH